MTGTAETEVQRVPRHLPPRCERDSHKPPG
jgi:hypothetical protein